MKRTICTALAAVCAFGVLTGAAFAQEGQTGIAVKAGWFFPQERIARDAGTNWFSAGFEYILRGATLGAPAPSPENHISVSLDYYGRGDFRHVPILLNWHRHFRNDLYFTGGVGIGFVTSPEAGPGPAATTTRSRFAYALGVGWIFQTGPSPLFAEIRWIGSQESAVNGFGTYIGMRF
jgi:hypothetical protein